MFYFRLGCSFVWIEWGNCELVQGILVEMGVRIYHIYTLNPPQSQAVVDLRFDPDRQAIDLNDHSQRCQRRRVYDNQLHLPLN